MEVLCCVLMPVLLAFFVIATMVRNGFDAWDARGRWGTVLTALGQHGDGAYRSVALQRRRLRGVPWSVAVSGVVGVGLALVTGLVFAPIGLFGGLLMVDPPMGRPVSTLGVVTLLAALSGFALAFGLYRATRAMLCCARGAGQLGLLIAAWSLLHHGALAGSYAFALNASGEGAAWLAVGPGLFGATHALLMLVAAQRVARIQRALPAHEWDALPGTAEATHFVDAEPDLVGLLGPHAGAGAAFPEPPPEDR